MNYRKKLSSNFPWDFEKVLDPKDPLMNLRKIFSFFLGRDEQDGAAISFPKVTFRYSYKFWGQSLGCTILDIYICCL